ncbi:tyrosine-type recombinase/integrase [Sphingomonas sp. Leaf25]|uniref:tyrosine-type recombinase/integrase n=1 Tax=Sphingomonas sp. Leaf25 TaxID=1735692 RepID=UPI0006FBBDEA|nr:site-specific integrase [Sphingomonas sp. Leaf25]KQM98734.1 integrase [Sphingomonas sp. Leaf25]
MATGKVNKRSVDALKPGTGVSFLWDDDLKGFGVKVTPAGALSYVLQYRMGGREAKTQRYSIGAHGSPWTPATARTEAERLLMLVAQGIDPSEADRKRRDDAVNLAFSAYADRFHAACKGDGWRALVARCLRLHVKPVLASKALPAITKADVVAVFDAMPADQQANRRNVFAVLRRLFRWAIGRGDIERTPMEGMETPPAVRARDRWLSDDELVRVWNAAPACHRCFGPIVRLLIATGQRREEVSGLDWSELNRADRLWRIPGTRTKNGEPTTVPLNDLAVAELDAVARGDKWPKRGRTFTTSSGEGFTAYSKGKDKLDATVAAAGDPLPAWRLHDLRRTLATGLQRLGVRFEVTEAVLNHVGGSRAGVAGVYQRHDWKQEKRDALDAWGRHVAACLTGVDDETNVVALRVRTPA